LAASPLNQSVTFSLNQLQLLAAQKLFHFGEKREVERHQVMTVAGMVKVFPIKFLKELCSFFCGVWS
jgi:hypothetical protein